MALKFCTSVAKELKLKVRKFWELIPTFVEIIDEKLVGGLFGPPILNRVKLGSCNICIKLNMVVRLDDGVISLLRNSVK